MSDKPSTKPEIKENMHPRNSHKAGYDFKALCKISDKLKPFVTKTEQGTESIDFSDPNAVKALNGALLKQYYGVDSWDIPEGYLCPPIPGRADYLHYIADLLGELNGGKAPRGKKIKVLDIGTGANLVYPLIGSAIYDWSFVGADIDAQAIRSAKDIISANPKFQNNILLRQQANKANIFKGIVKDGEGFDLTMCNPPFHASAQEAQISTATKWKKLGLEAQKTALNFGGQKAELWTPGGEIAFIRKMVEQSALVAKQVLWFTTLVSKKDSLPLINKALHGHKALEVKTITMTHGQKTSRIVAWTFQTPEEQQAWKKDFWVD
ncbi:23S rRNA (adenine(1618)-N(6))-methyltransferase RlmF [Mucilaginibacter myungsuensis]|uniref:Ribosomal RNA large subunit methyltransferase F n=1 Tax=Mucilaginibacter myungsuensis TaxID=649104 RepID=A0A929KYI7_9SPHI|nr:23S rRNA (adenine(1618)-N(6))-methyltransferase RlmF [Mucilaginibacter myungsuensis]MBE9664031.1 23S rRNA (adenine(1618)-N(6))-methyltransferase RlmF [Mucilaginibacter myungsuensis]MDN3601210.1 23S rRNA (adenine(1618)-N(6))-methyltransferase RlmF [Mucilaginibacter myungsuensis]